MASWQDRLSREELLRRIESAVAWGPALVGVGILVAFLIVAVILPTGGSPPPISAPPITATAGPSPPETPSSSASDDGDEGEEEAGTAAGGRPQRSPSSPRPAQSPAQPTPSPSPTPSPDGDLVGEYRLVESYDDRFIGQVVISNNTPRALDWTVRLEFPEPVGALLAWWVDGAPRPTMRQEGRLHEFRGAAPVDPRSSATLKVLYNRSGSDLRPSDCTVNGFSCEVHSP